MATRDEQLIQRMLAYCDEILGTLDYFGRDEQRFDTDYIMRNALAMPLQQIGELATHATDSLIAARRSGSPSGRRSGGIRAIA